MIPEANIRQRYEKNDFLKYPQMEKLYDEAIHHPNRDIEIPDDFASKTLPKSNFIVESSRKIKFFLQAAVIKTKCLLSSSYREKHNLAIRKIETAYSKKISDIAKVAHGIMMSKEKIATTKESGAVSDLFNRVQSLKEELRTDQEKLEALMEKKHDVVEQAKALKKHREEAPTIGNKLEQLWDQMVGNKVVEPEVEFINANDETPLTEQLTDENIALYEKGQYLISRLLREIQNQSAAVESKKGAIEEEEKKLADLQTKMQTQAFRIEDTVKEAKQAKLENFFDDEDFQVPDVAIESTSTVEKKELSSRELKLRTVAQDIAARTGSKELGELFTILINRLPDEIESWKCDADGNFTLKLPEPSYIWMPTKETKGGAILMFGHGQNGEIRGKLEKNAMKFTSGANNYVSAPIFGLIQTTFDGVKFHSKINIEVGGTGKGITRWVQKTFSSIKDNWSEKGTVVPKDYPGGYDQFLKNKIEGK